MYMYAQDITVCIVCTKVEAHVLYMYMYTVHSHTVHIHVHVIHVVMYIYIDYNLLLIMLIDRRALFPLNSKLQAVILPSVANLIDKQYY